MENLLKAIINHVNQADSTLDIKFGFADPKVDGTSINIISQAQNIVSYRGTTSKVLTFTAYCLYSTITEALNISNNIFNYLTKHKKINATLNIVNISGINQVPFKQHRYLCTVEFSILGFESR